MQAPPRLPRALKVSYSIWAVRLTSGRTATVVSSGATVVMTPRSTARDVGIFGAGAAGLAAAYFASENPDVMVTVYEKMDEAGKKIKASGGSRCNILPNPDRDPPLNIETDFHIPQGTKKGALRALLCSWDLQSCRGWLEHDVGIPLKLEAAANKLFPQSDSGAEVRDKLLAAVVRRQNVRLEMGAELVRVEVEQGKELPESAASSQDARFQRPGTASGNAFRCLFADGSERIHSRIVLATGGKSFASLGTTGTGYEVLMRLGVAINAPQPALTPLLFARKENALVHLAGVTLQQAVMTVSYQDVRAAAAGRPEEETKSKKKAKKKSKATVRQAVRGQSLITHRGMSVRFVWREDPVLTMR